MTQSQQSRQHKLLSLLTLSLQGSHGLILQTATDKPLRLHWIENEVRGNLQAALAMCSDFALAKSEGERCRLTFQQYGWWYWNQSTSLMMTVNDKPVFYQEQIRLNDGDVLSIGLHTFRCHIRRMLIGNDHLQYVLNERQYFLNQLSGHAIASSNTLSEDFTSNDKNSFIALELDAAKPSSSPTLEVDSDFDLTSLASNVNVLTQSFGHFFNHVAAELPIHNAIETVTSLDKNNPFIHDPNQAVIKNTSVNFAVGVEQFQRNQSEEEIDKVPNNTSDLLESLHQEYFEVLRDPSKLMVDLANAEIIQRQDAQEDVFQDLIKTSSYFDNVYGVLGMSEQIDPVLATLDDMPPSYIFEPEQNDNVLHLFAPANLFPTRRISSAYQELDSILSNDVLGAFKSIGIAEHDPLEALALLNQKSSQAPNFSPELSRREHHILSLDSGLHIETWNAVPKNNNE